MSSLVERLAARCAQAVFGRHCSHWIYREGDHCCWCGASTPDDDE